MLDGQQLWDFVFKHSVDLLIRWTVYWRRLGFYTLLKQKLAEGSSFVHSMQVRYVVFSWSDDFVNKYSPCSWGYIWIVGSQVFQFL